MDLRPQGQDIIRTWLVLHHDGSRASEKVQVLAGAEQTTAVGLDPRSNYKKMSKSKGNVVAGQADRPVRRRRGALLAAAARLGLDATYDEGQMKIGRRLAHQAAQRHQVRLGLVDVEDENHHVGAPATAT